MAKYVTEFLGAFFLVLTIGLTVMQGTPLAPLAIGAALTVMVYMGGHVSGAHYNPAVSAALALAGKLERRDLLPYVASQVAGAVAAALAVRAMAGDYLVVAPGPETPAGVALLAESLFAFALVLVVLNVATDARTEGNSFYGLAIGLTVMTGAFAVGGISGGAFNPAVGTGPILVAFLGADGSLGDLWLYWAGPVAGAVGAVGVHRAQGADADDR